MEAYLDQEIEEGQAPKTPLEAVAHVLPNSTFLQNVGMQLTTKKKNIKVAEMSARVHDLQSELQAAQMGSAGLQSQVSDLEKQLEEQKEASRKIEEAAKKNAEETEKVRQKTLEMQGFLRTLFAEKFASCLLPDLQQ